MTGLAAHMPEISFSEEQAMLLETAAAFAAETAARRRIRDLVDDPQGFDRDAWRQMVELGWTGLVAPEAHGGSELGVSHAAPIVESLGARLIATPLVGSLLASYALAACENDALSAAWQPKLCAGAVGALALGEGAETWAGAAPKCSATRAGDALKLQGRKRFIPYAAFADLVIASVALDGRGQLVALTAEQLKGRITPEVSTDATQSLAAISLDGLDVPASQALTNADLAAVWRTATLLLAAEMCGGVSGAMDMTLDYLKTRTQFGRPIGAYQGLKHTMANAYVQYELLRSLVYAAASNLESNQGDMLVRMAKAKASELYMHVADRAVQFHGGFGFTYECDAGFYLRRAIWSQSQLGNASHHRKRLATMLLDT